MSINVASTSPRITRQGASNTPSSIGRNKVIVINDNTPSRSAKRSRRSAPEVTSRRSSARLASTTPKKGTAVSCRDDDDDDDDKESSNSSSEGDDLTTSIKKAASSSPGKNLVHLNSFDAYFAATSKPSRTSKSVFSQLLPRLPAEELAALLRSSNAVSKNAVELAGMLHGHKALFPRYALELSEGFNLLFFGFGSKRALLDSFARTICAPRGHVVIVNAYQPRISIRDVLTCIEEVPGLTDIPLAHQPSSPEAQARRIYDFFLPPAVRPNHPTASRPLFLIVHNIDAPAMRVPRAKATLSLLAMSPRIHLVASIDHVHAQTLWSTAEASARKHIYAEGASTALPPTRGFAWAWHDMTTMEPYDAELAHIDITRIPGKAGKAAVAAAERQMTETAAQHILASVNEKAKKLFALLARTQLANMEEDGQKSAQSQTVSYSSLFNAARSDFIATNDTTFKALLAEFRDHKLVIFSPGSGGEKLGIPLRTEELRRLLEVI